MAEVRLPSGQEVLCEEDESGHLIQVIHDQGVGADGTGITAPEGGTGVRGWLSGIYKAVTQALTVKRIPDTTVVAGNLTSAAGEASEVKMAVTPGMSLLTAWFKGTYSTATVVMEASRDSGVTWMPVAGATVGGGAATVAALSAATNAVPVWEGAIPAGATHVRAHCTAITSGTVEVSLYQGSSQYETVMAVVQSGLAASAAVIGTIVAAGSWVDLSSTPLEKEKTFTSAALDTTGVATATAFSNASTGVGEYRISATADVLGTLYLETSRDNVTFTRIKLQILTQADATCKFYGELIHKPSERYVRAVFVNGATNQASFKIQQVKLGIA